MSRVDLVLPLLAAIILLLFRRCESQGFLDFLNFGLSGTSHHRRSPTFQDFANQGVGLFNYLTNIQRNPVPSHKPKRRHSNFLNDAVEGLGLPKLPFLEGVPVVPGVSGSVPGVGECLPRGTPLVNPISPSFFQDLLRGIPIAQDVLRSFQRLPDVDMQRLMGEWYWVLYTPSVHTSYCATSQYSGLTYSHSNQTSFSVVNKFREGSTQGAPKVGFGYGVSSPRGISLYTQTDPCPYQVVKVGPTNSNNRGQYEYVILSNWAKYPVIGLAKNLRPFYGKYYKEMDSFLRKENYVNFFTDAMGSVQYAKWSHCRGKVNTGNIVGNILNGLFFGKK